MKSKEVHQSQSPRMHGFRYIKIKIVISVLRPQGLLDMKNTRITSSVWWNQNGSTAFLKVPPSGNDHQ